eukprot:6126799-Amphidinium_carterae.1
MDVHTLLQTNLHVVVNFIPVKIYTHKFANDLYSNIDPRAQRERERERSLHCNRACSQATFRLRRLPTCDLVGFGFITSPAHPQDIYFKGGGGMYEASVLSEYHPLTTLCRLIGDTSCINKYGYVTLPVLLL